MPHHMDTEEARRVGATIRALREAQGWTVDRLAIAIGKSRPHLANVEAGRKRPSPQVLRLLADAMHVPLAALVSDKYVTADEADNPNGGAAA